MSRALGALVGVVLSGALVYGLHLIGTAWPMATFPFTVLLGIAGAIFFGLPLLGLVAVCGAIIAGCARAAAELWDTPDTNQGG